MRRILTLAAVAVAAFALADVAHEALGHGGMCAALGAKIVYVSTTFEDCSIRSWIIDGAGPSAGIAAALLCWLWLAAMPPRGAASRAFLLLGFAFAAFWNFGYLIKSGLTGQGDWAFVIEGLKPAPLWHAGITIAGIALYWISIRLLAGMMKRHLESEDATGFSPLAFSLIAYGTAAAVACAGAYFDPRGPATILHDALPSSLGAFGLPLAGALLARTAPNLRVVLPGSFGWIAVGMIAGIAFVALLGPGLRL
ncbi:MAG TPA: hypothetical protein VFV07_12170 [Rhizomicrobium sp.]|nr:hypothetical protein [Rhizomicrobium sp.]